MKKKIWHFFLVFLWKIQKKITDYSINKWYDKGLISDFGFITDLDDDKN